MPRADGRVLLTLNRKHFVRLHGERPDHAGMILCTFDPDFVGQARRIHAAIQEQHLLGIVDIERAAVP